MHRIRVLAPLSLVLLLCFTLKGWAQEVDSDHDGLSDALEQKLLDQFRPDFRVGEGDCAGLPAAFLPGVNQPTPGAADGTIYGQASVVHGEEASQPQVELHFFHLWSRDCGEHGHPLDTEHVAVLLKASGSDLPSASWKAQYWYAAAHENTVCDVSQIAHAAALHAEDRGAIVWISPDKHASYLDVALCSHGCGADRCERMRASPKGRLVNLGEAKAPMNGSVFVSSASWPLAAKMEQSNFSEAALSRARQLPANEIALYNAGRHPMQGVIAISASTESAIAQSGDRTGAALSVAGDKTNGALDNAQTSTGNALSSATGKTGSALAKSYRSTRGALGRSLRHLSGVSKSDEKPKPNE